MWRSLRTNRNRSVEHRRQARSEFVDGDELDRRLSDRDNVSSSRRPFGRSRRGLAACSAASAARRFRRRRRPRGERRYRAARRSRSWRRSARSRRVVPRSASPPGQRRETPAAPPQTEAQVVAGQEREIRRGPPQHPGAGRRQLIPGQPSGDRGAAAGHQHAARQGAVAGAGRVAGFGRQRRTACAQRARQRAIPHQRHHAARRRRRASDRSSTPASSAAWR